MAILFFRVLSFVRRLRLVFFYSVIFLCFRVLALQIRLFCLTDGDDDFFLGLCFWWLMNLVVLGSSERYRSSKPSGGPWEEEAQAQAARAVTEFLLYGKFIHSKFAHFARMVFVVENSNLYCSFDLSWWICDWPCFLRRFEYDMGPA